MFKNLPVSGDKYTCGSPSELVNSSNSCGLKKKYINNYSFDFFLLLNKNGS